MRALIGWLVLWFMKPVLQARVAALSARFAETDATFVRLRSAGREQHVTTAADPEAEPG